METLEKSDIRYGKEITRSWFTDLIADLSQRYRRHEVLSFELTKDRHEDYEATFYVKSGAGKLLLKKEIDFIDQPEQAYTLKNGHLYLTN